MVIYNRQQQIIEDAELEFRLRRSISIAKENKVANKKKAAESKERSAVSRERKLALALRAVLEAYANVAVSDEFQEEVTEAEQAALDVLNELGYGSLVGIPTRVKELNEQLKAAVESGDGKEIARLGLELERAKAGKAPLVVKTDTKAEAATK